MYDMKEGDNREETLKCKLTTEEITARGEELAALLGDRNKVELEKKAAADRFKQQLSELASRSEEIATEIREKAEWRDVKITAERLDDKMAVIRMDTGEVIWQRPLTNDERQVQTVPSVDGQGDLRATGGRRVVSAQGYRDILGTQRLHRRRP